MTERKKYMLCLAVGGVLCAVITLLALCTLRGFGGILQAADNAFHLGVQDFVAIFSQLQNACVLPPVWLPLSVGFLLSLWFFRIRRAKVWVRAVFAVLCVLIILIVYLCTVVLSFANGVLFLDIILSLIKNAGGLGL